MHSQIIIIDHQKKHFGSARRLNNRASRIFEASVEALGLDQAPLISGPVGPILFFKSTVTDEDESQNA